MCSAMVIAAEGMLTQVGSTVESRNGGGECLELRADLDSNASWDVMAAN